MDEVRQRRPAPIGHTVYDGVVLRRLRPFHHRRVLHEEERHRILELNKHDPIILFSSYTRLKSLGSRAYCLSDLLDGRPETSFVF